MTREGGGGSDDDGSSKVGAVCGRFLGGLSPRCEGPEGLASARGLPEEDGRARIIEKWERDGWKKGRAGMGGVKGRYPKMENLTHN